jgi:hypothetical protein
VLQRGDVTILRELLGKTDIWPDARQTSVLCELCVLSANSACKEFCPA